MLSTAAQTWDRQMQHVQKGKRLFLRINRSDKGSLISFKDFSSNLGRLSIASFSFDFYKMTGDKSHKIKQIRLTVIVHQGLLSVKQAVIPNSLYIMMNQCYSNPVHRIVGKSLQGCKICSEVGHLCTLAILHLENDILGWAGFFLGGHFAPLDSTIP